jgi:hypothetical protein
MQMSYFYWLTTIASICEPGCLGSTKRKLKQNAHKFVARIRAADDGERREPFPSPRRFSILEVVISDQKVEKRPNFSAIS